MFSSFLCVQNRKKTLEKNDLKISFRQIFYLYVKKMFRTNILLEKTQILPTFCPKLTVLKQTLLFLHMGEKKIPDISFRFTRQRKSIPFPRCTCVTFTCVSPAEAGSAGSGRSWISHILTLPSSEHDMSSLKHRETEISTTAALCGDQDADVVGSLQLCLRVFSQLINSSCILKRALRQ